MGARTEFTATNDIVIMRLQCIYKSKDLHYNYFPVYREYSN